MKGKQVGELFFSPSPTLVLPLPKGGGGFGERPSPTLVLPLPKGGGGSGMKRGGDLKEKSSPSKRGRIKVGVSLRLRGGGETSSSD